MVEVWCVRSVGGSAAHAGRKRKLLGHGHLSFSCVQTICSTLAVCPPVEAMQIPLFNTFGEPTSLRVKCRFLLVRSEATERTELRTLVASWNVGNAVPDLSLHSWLPHYRVTQAGLIVVATQECEYPPRDPHPTCLDDFVATLGTMSLCVSLCLHSVHTHTHPPTHSLFVSLCVYTRYTHTSTHTHTHTHTNTHTHTHTLSHTHRCTHV